MNAECDSKRLKEMAEIIIRYASAYRFFHRNTSNCEIFETGTK